MSVINKMLRDLDSRQNPSVPTGRAAAANSTDFVRPTVSENPQARAAPASFTLQRVAVAVAALALVAGSVAVGWWLLGRTVPVQPMAVAPQSQPLSPAAPFAVATPPAPASAVVARVASEPTPAASAAVVNVPAAQVSAGETAQIPSIAPATQSPQTSLPSQASTVTPPVPAARTAQPALPANAPAMAQIAPPVAASAAPPTGLVAPRVSQPTPVQSPTAGPTAPSQPVPVAPAPATRSAPAQEVLAQAQTLWNNGARAGAVELLREAIAPTERAASAAGASPASAPTVALVRELTRMELAEGRPAQVLTLLTHLEPVIATQADLWAVRGNAAQRLGRHAESVAAYQAALKLRPSEPRWMLGAAVSLAIQGHVTEATDLADQARNHGPISPDMRGYLRQLGVMVREP
jgi:MSHA biogenesis protein MshN